MLNCLCQSRVQFKYSIKDHEGRTFNFFTTKQDGTDTSAFSQFKSMGLKMGDTVMIGYVEDEFQMDGKTIISKKIISFREANDTPSQTPARQESSNLGHSGASGGVLKDDAFWEKQAYEKCCSLWAAAGIQYSGKLAQAREAIESGAFYELFQAIKADGNKRFSPLRQAVQRHAPSVVDDDLPIIQQDYEVDVEDIPF